MKDFVPFKLAQKLKEKGFEWVKITTYNPKTKVRNNHLEPTILQVLKWLREEKKLYVGVTYSPKIEGSQDFFYATIQYIGDYKKTIYPNDSYDNWEGAALNGIEYAIDNNLIL